MTCILCEWLSRQHIESIHQSNLLVFVMTHANFRLGTLRTLSIATLPHIIATHAHAHAHTHARTHPLTPTPTHPPTPTNTHTHTHTRTHTHTHTHTLMSTLL